MNPASVIRDTRADGVRLTVSSAGTIKATGESAAVNKWLPVLREHKTALLGVLQSANDEPATVLLTDQEEAAIRAWLALIEETDPATIAEVIERCQKDEDARRYFLARAAAGLRKPVSFSDGRHTCRDCGNLRAGVCRAASPSGPVIAERGYRPSSVFLTIPHRCEGYEPALIRQEER